MNLNKSVLLDSRWWLLVIIAGLVLLSGCAATATSMRALNREGLVRLQPGMARSDVLTTMGTESTEITYKRPDGSLATEIITNPYRTETLHTSDGTFAEVLFYFTDFKSDDGAITDDELTPMFLEDGRLVGWGWSFAEENVSKYEIRTR